MDFINGEFRLIVLPVITAVEHAHINQIHHVFLACQVIKDIYPQIDVLARLDIMIMDNTVNVNHAHIIVIHAQT